MKPVLSILGILLISSNLTSCGVTREAANTTHDAASVARDVWDIRRIVESF